jgi:hypothetical protein
MSANLNPDKALIFRIVHVDNLPWILKHGLHSRNSPRQDPNYISIGKQDLIDHRRNHPVPIPPLGVLGDYVSFYFTPFSPMMLNIRTGYNGVTRRENREVAILVSSIHRLREQGIPFVFTNLHAYMAMARFFSRVDDLDQIDWPLLQRRDFKADDADPDKGPRYQAEALVHQHVPLNALVGIGCYNDVTRGLVQSEAESCGLALSVKTTPNWYFQ